MNPKKLADVSYKTLMDSNYRTNLFAGLGFYDRMDDEKYLKKLYKANFGKELDLENPKTFNEKLQWLKLYDRKPEYTMMVDKYRVRKYIAEELGEEYLIPLLGVWDDPEEIDFDKLPNQFVLKCNHNSGLGMCICKDKSKLDIKKVKAKLKKGLKQDYYLHGREWPYKNVPRKIIAEQFMKSDAGGLTDYKVHCFNGEPKFILVCKDRFTKTGLTEDFFAPDWEHLDLRRPSHPNAAPAIEKPAELTEILTLARTLSANVPFLRVDFYIIEHKVYFSELTFFPQSGFGKYEPDIWDEKFGEWINLPEKFNNIHESGELI